MSLTGISQKQKLPKRRLWLLFGGLTADVMDYKFSKIDETITAEKNCHLINEMDGE